VLATAIVALGFQPVRRRLWPIAARLARGERAAPHQVLTRFVDEVAGGYTTDEVPARMARLLVEATGARYAQVWLIVNDKPLLAATWPEGVAESESGPDAPAVHSGRHVLDVSHAGQALGMLVLAERDGQPLTPVEEQLFAGLAAQAGLVLRSVLLRAELAARLEESTKRAQELRASRERIVAAQDEQRQRLERDIHDGAQQHLVALAVNLRLARTLVTRSSPRAPAVLTELKRAAEDTIETLSDLSRGIYPRALAEHGLAAALDVAAAAGPLPVDVTVQPAIPWPADDIAAALYFCCLEAMQNAAKHSQATRVTVGLRRTAEGWDLLVSDDGVGFAPGSVGPGSGLVNLRDRAESMGGRLELQSEPGRGTVITVSVPEIGAGS
jgi:signal transduction histidine kinase